MRHIFPAGFLAATVLLTACAGPPLYQPQSGSRSFGYTERAVGMDLLEITYKAPRRSTHAYYSTQRESDRRLELAYDLTLLRAAELALSRNGIFVIRRRDNDAQVRIEQAYRSHQPGYTRYYSSAIPYSRYDREPYAIILATVTLLVDFAPSLTEDSFDAAQTVTRLHTQYADELPL